MEEYPHRYATLRAHSLIKSKAFTDADLHLIAERTGDVMCYLFFRQAPDGSRSGITLCVNGYACRNLDRLALLAAPVVDALSDFVFDEGHDARSRAFITSRLGELREKLEVATDLGESSLSPLDYAIKDDNYISYVWGYADPKAILSSSEQGLIHVRFPGTVTPTLLPPAPKVKSSESFSFDSGRAIFLLIVSLVSLLLVIVYFDNKYQKEKALRISVEDELSHLQYESGEMDSRVEEIKDEIDRSVEIARSLSTSAADQKKLRQKQEELDPAEETRSAPQSTEYPRESQTTASTPSQPARRVHQKASSAFEIKKVDITNENSAEAFPTSFGSPIDAAESMYLHPRIIIEAKTDFSGKYRFHLKFKHRDWDDSSLTVLYETQCDVDLVCSKGVWHIYDLPGSGTSHRGTWPEGVYLLEIWSDGQCLYTHSFVLY